MTDTTWPELSRAELIELPPEAREGRLLAFLLDLVPALRMPPGEAPGPDERLSELGLDSLQFIEMKFALDTLVGEELDIEPFVEDPTLEHVAGLASTALAVRLARADA